jgi:Flp pilus assembly protein TadG
MQTSFIRSISCRFATDRRGNVAVIFAMCSLVLIGLAGLGIDYYRALTLKARLDLAADAAAIAAINTAKAYIAAHSASQTNPGPTATTMGEAQALKVFQVNAGAAMNFTQTPTINVTYSSGQMTITSSVLYNAVSPNSFGALFGVKQMNLSNASGGGTQATVSLGQYLNFYLLLDVSGSMGLPSTGPGQTALAAISPDDKWETTGGCVFACHFTEKMCNTTQNGSDSVCQGYTLAHQNNIQLRAAAVGVAVQDLIQTAQATATVPNQFGVGIYPFISQMGTFFALSTNLPAVSSAITALGTDGLSSLLDTGQSTSVYGSGGTHFENVLPAMNNTITNVGTGATSSSPQPFVFLVTDGVDNNQFYTTSSNNWTGSQPQSITTSFCSTLKTRGIVISVLYIPYTNIPTAPPSSPVTPEINAVNAVIPSIPTTLQQCASPGFFFTANTPQDITNAMQVMFNQALSFVHLTH